MATHKNPSLLLLILTLSLISAATAVSPPSPSLLNAADTLANSDHISMSLSLQLIAQTLPNTLTIFAPPDSAFISAGQPPLSHLLLHISPVSISPASLRSLSTLPSLSQSKHLTVTSNSPPISINNVAISDFPIFDDGLVVVYAIDTFFDFNFNTNDSPPDPVSYTCSNSESESRFREVSGVLKSRGYSIMASFLDLQLMGYVGDGNDMVKWTVFAPLDEELLRFSGSFVEYSSIFMRHVVPCKVRWGDMGEMGNGSVIWKNMDGFDMVVVKRDDDGMVMVNGAVVTAPEMYDDESIVVHGIRGMISSPDEDDNDSFESPDG